LVGVRKEKTTPFGVNLMRSQVLYLVGVTVDNRCHDPSGAKGGFV